ncbi:oxysterol-binding protein-related protein 3 [Engraulis encrasicolus]|uniref:oxysterol-binding protein-related protein 3 n=1 Tax=Engraulis encrasicolus TaxID=184585 RepID=UPI002FCF9717
MCSEERQPGVSQKISTPSSLSNSSSSSKHDGRQDSWEMVEALYFKMVPATMQEPNKQEGYVLKRRKWPMKGWHKRYFLLDKGILKYSKCAADMERGKLHGCIDVGLSVMAIKKKAKCIDLNAEENIYHLKVKSQELFDEWVSQLRRHRVFRQNEIIISPLDKTHTRRLTHTHTHSHSRSPTHSHTRSPTHSPTHFPPSPPANATHTPSTKSSQDTVADWLHTSDHNMEQCSKELCVCETQLGDLNSLLENMEVLHRTYSAPAINALQVAYGSPKKEKRRWRPKHYKEGKHTLQVPSCISSVRLHASNPNLSSAELANEIAEQLDAHDDVTKLQEEFCHIAANLHSSMSVCLEWLKEEADRLKKAELQTTRHAHNSHVTPTSHAHNSHAASSSAHNTQVLKIALTQERGLVHQVSVGSHCSRGSVSDSLTEFFDAHEVLLSNSSSENEASEDDSCVSDVSDNVSADFNTVAEETEHSDIETTTGWRVCLPAPSPNTSGISLWNILKNNIGKDLSKVAMPVQLNEPLNTLQRLCEELEYSELLDTAAHTHDAYTRMMYVGVFAVSGYASSYFRAGGKPFNPLLGETYECNRPDRGFRFIAEQVSHHPPVSACHAESKTFSFWQDVRWKNKFWGKSMEIVPIGTTHVELPGFGDHYEWNKVTSCIHNILSGQRWIEHYGEINIRNTHSNACTMKITFTKAKYWSSSANEIQGAVLDEKGKTVLTVIGRWHEALYCDDAQIWRANPMPVDHDQYYGFTKFAVELNELKSSMKTRLPPTDTRLRPDQRLLEEGCVEAAEEQKSRIEQLQRERRRVHEDNDLTHTPRFFTKSRDDSWISNATYWELRAEPGFSRMDFPVLW